MKKIMLYIFIFISALLGAQDSICKPGNCTTKISGKYKVELAGCRNYLDIYLLDSKNRPVRGEEIRGTVEYFFLDKSSISSEFEQYYRSNSLRAIIPSSVFTRCRITLEVNDEFITVYFNNECNLRVQLIKPHSND